MMQPPMFFFNTHHIHPGQQKENKSIQQNIKNYFLENFLAKSNFYFTDIQCFKNIFGKLYPNHPVEKKNIWNL